MNAGTVFKETVTMAGAAIMQTTEADWHRPTPCSEWDLHALVNHMVSELVWIPDLLAGKTVAEVGDVYNGDLLGNDPGSAWNNSVVAAREAIDGADLSVPVHMSAGDAPGSQYIEEVSADLLIHGWDVAKALNQPFDIPAPLLEWANKTLSVLHEKYGQYGVFGTPVEVAPDASAQTKLLGMLGRTA